MIPTPYQAIVSQPMMAVGGCADEYWQPVLPTHTGQYAAPHIILVPVCSMGPSSVHSFDGAFPVYDPPFASTGVVAPAMTPEPECSYWQGTAAISVEDGTLQCGSLPGQEEPVYSALQRMDWEMNGSFDTGVSATPHDFKDCASSEASTAVSTSARRRRHRRTAKARELERAPMGLTAAVVTESDTQNLEVSRERKMELIQQLESSNQKLKSRAISSILGSTRKMSFEPYGCRVVQKALEVGNVSEREVLVDQIRGHVTTMVASPHANFVIQKVIEVLPIGGASFVAEELATFATEVARHRFGCRILCRLVEHHLCGEVVSTSTNDLVAELLQETDHLIHHNFARHVLELILEHGNAAHKKSIAYAARNNIFQYAKHRNASYVVEKAIACCSAVDVHAIAAEILSDVDQFLVLAVHECGCHVVKAVINSPNSSADCSQKAKEVLLAKVDIVTSTKYGLQLLEQTHLLNMTY